MAVCALIMKTPKFCLLTSGKTSACLHLVASSVSHDCDSSAVKGCLMGMRKPCRCFLAAVSHPLSFQDSTRRSGNSHQNNLTELKRCRFDDAWSNAAELIFWNWMMIRNVFLILKIESLCLKLHRSILHAFFLEPRAFLHTPYAIILASTSFK